jgi:hypothetical protein
MKTVKDIVEEVKSYTATLDPHMNVVIEFGMGFLGELGWYTPFPDWVDLEYNSDFDDRRLYFKLFEGTMSLERSVYPKVHIHGELIKDFYQENNK